MFRRFAAPLAALLTVAGLLVGCGGAPEPGADATGAPAATLAADRAPSPGGTASGSAPTTGAPAAGTFTGTVSALPPQVAQEMTGVSWRPGCPVPLADLRLVSVSYVGFDGATHRGELVAHHELGDALVRIFARLHEARFPIRRMVRIEAYGGSDDASMADDNTSMFNCRTVPGTTRLSNHAYGRAIDINTVENPYLPGRQVMPSAGAAYLNRGHVRPGMIVSGDVVVRTFKAEGFRWGGDWTSGRDYQHFEKAR